jgi:hypothetical protein
MVQECKAVYCYVTLLLFKVRLENLFQYVSGPAVLLRCNLLSQGAQLQMITSGKRGQYIISQGGKRNTAELHSWPLGSPYRTYATCCNMKHSLLRTVTLLNPIIYFFPPEGGVGLVPKRGCLLTLAYYAFPRRYEFGERRWNDIDRGNRKTRRKICPSINLSTINPTWIDPGANPGLRGETPTTNDLSHGTTHLFIYF